MRIAIDARALGPHFPGITRATLGLLSGLRELDHTDHLLILHQPSGLPLLARTGVDVDERFELRAVELGPFAPAQQWRLPGIARANKLDVWHAPYYFRPFFGLLPTVVTIFDMIGPGVEGQAKTRSRLRTLLWQLAMQLSIRTARRIITTSQAARRDLHAAYKCGDEAIRVIPLAADRRFSPRSPEAIRSVRQQYDLPETYVLYLGSNKPHKNLQALVEAWSVAIEEHQMDDASLIIAGREDPRYPAARHRAAELRLGSRLRFLADIDDDDLPALLSGARCFVFPSLREGFGLPPLEAMACGTPVIASNLSSMPEVVGDAGLLVEPEAGALSAAIARVLADDALRDELSARGLLRAAQYSWLRTARATLEVYHEVGR